MNRKSVAEAVADSLRRQIQRRELLPGQRVRQRDVAARLSVSTTPVREALQILQMEGLIVLDPNRGAMVSIPSRQEIVEIYEMRELLEGLAIAKAVPKLTSRDIRRLDALLRLMKERPEGSKRSPLNTEFHLLIYRRSGRRTLCQLIERLRDVCSLYIEGMHQLEAVREQVDQEHQDIIDACRQRDVVSAKSATSRHLWHTAQVMLGDDAPQVRAGPGELSRTEDGSKGTYSSSAEGPTSLQPTRSSPASVQKG